MELISAVITAAIAGAFAAVIAMLIRNKKKGKHICSCGGSCGNCPMSESCASRKK